MIRLFRSYHPGVIVLLLAYALLLRMTLFITPVPFVPPQDVNLLGKLFYRLIERYITSAPYFYHIIALLLTFIQALYFNYIVNKNRLLPQLSYLPAFAFLLVASLFAEFLLCTPALLANLFLLLALARLLDAYKKDSVFGLLFDVGLFISIASMFFFPFLVFIIFGMASLIVLRPFHIREMIMMLLGLLVPYYLAGVYFFWIGRFAEFISLIQITQIKFNTDILEHSSRILVLGITVALVLLWALLAVQRNFFKMVVQARLSMIVFAWFLIAGILSMFVQFNGELFHFVWISAPAGMAFAKFYAEVKRGAVSEFLHFFLLLSILFFQYYFLLDL